ncbi:MAG: porin, partial [Epsilonproteobacteria bacterium]|nr:porin [Campylobacterota bacterium]
AFEGASIVNTDLPNTTLTAAYVQKFQAQTDGAGNIGKFTTYSNPYGVSPLLEDGAYTLVAVNKSITGLTLTAAYAEDLNTNGAMAYAEAAYSAMVNAFTYGLAAQYYYSDKDVTGSKNADLYGLKASLGYGALGGYVAYSSVSKDATVTPGIGWGADLAYTGTIILSSSYPANTDAYAIGLSYAFTPTTTLATSYTITDDDDLSYGKASYVSLTGNYAFEGALKGLNLLVMYDKENRDKAGALDKHEFRFSASYKF